MADTDAPDPEAASPRTPETWRRLGGELAGRLSGRLGRVMLAGQGGEFVKGELNIVYILLAAGIEVIAFVAAHPVDQFGQTGIGQLGRC